MSDLFERSPLPSEEVVLRRFDPDNPNHVKVIDQQNDAWRLASSCLRWDPAPDSENPSHWGASVRRVQVAGDIGLDWEDLVQPPYVGLASVTAGLVRMASTPACPFNVLPDPTPDDPAHALIVAPYNVNKNRLSRLARRVVERMTTIDRESWESMSR